jgi:hypothetical protein
VFRNRVGTSLRSDPVTLDGRLIRAVRRPSVSVRFAARTLKPGRHLLRINGDRQRRPNEDDDPHLPRLPPHRGRDPEPRITG